MSDVNFYGVLCMPYELAMSDELSRRQFYNVVQEAVKRLQSAPSQEQEPVDWEKELREWNDCTGALPKNGSWFWEVASMLERASNIHPAQPLNDVLDLIKDDEAKEFWKGVYPNGITAQDLANELSDMNIMMDNVPKIVYAVTGGLLSKATYPAETVIAKFNDYVDDVVKENIEDYKEENQLEPLSDDEMSKVFDQFDWKELEIAGEHLDLFKFARAIEKAHGIGL